MGSRKGFDAATARRPCNIPSTEPTRRLAPRATLSMRPPSEQRAEGTSSVHSSWMSCDRPGTASRSRARGRTRDRRVRGPSRAQPAAAPGRPFRPPRGRRAARAAGGGHAGAGFSARRRRQTRPQALPRFPDRLRPSGTRFKRARPSLGDERAATLHHLLTAPLWGLDGAARRRLRSAYPWRATRAIRRSASAWSCRRRLAPTDFDGGDEPTPRISFVGPCCGASAYLNSHITERF
jgi:hypothetical protein